jgi:glycosyltransferase involved in cell wall biosynthesis
MSVYNGGEFLQDAIGSILGQTFSDFEFIIIDDGSTDATPNLLRKISDSRVRVLSQPNRGLVASLNRGIKEARAEIIARMDADDISEPTRLAKQLDLLKAKTKIGIVGCAFRMFTIDNDAGAPIKYVMSFDEDIKRALLVRNPYAHGSIMARKSVLLAGGGYQEDGPIEDFALWARLIPTTEFAGLEEVLYRWRINPGGISQSKAAEQLQLVTAIQQKLEIPRRLIFFLFTSMLARYCYYNHQDRRLGSDLSRDYVHDQFALAELLWRRRQFIKSFLVYLPACLLLPESLIIGAK